MNMRAARADSRLKIDRSSLVRTNNNTARGSIDNQSIENDSFIIVSFFIIIVYYQTGDCETLPIFKYFKARTEGLIKLAGMNLN